MPLPTPNPQPTPIPNPTPMPVNSFRFDQSGYMEAGTSIFCARGVRALICFVIPGSDFCTLPSPRLHADTLYWPWASCPYFGLFLGQGAKSVGCLSDCTGFEDVELAKPKISTRRQSSPDVLEKILQSPSVSICSWEGNNEWRALF